MKANGTKVCAAARASPKIDLRPSLPDGMRRQLERQDARRSPRPSGRSTKLTMKIRRNSLASARRGRDDALLDLSVIGSRLRPSCDGASAMPQENDGHAARSSDAARRACRATRAARDPLLAGRARVALGAVAQALGGGDADQDRLGLDAARRAAPGPRRPTGSSRRRRAGVASTRSSSVPSGRMWNSASNSALQTSCTR